MKPFSSADARRKTLGSIVALIGFILSPLSWWNDLVVNVPLALAFAWLVSLVNRRAFATSFVVGYWLTNIIGLVLLDRGAATVLSRQARPFGRRQMAVNLAISLGYTGLILLLVRFRVFAPLPDYLAGHR
jgi:hypothetical protein